MELLRETFVNLHAIEQTRFRGSPEVSIPHRLGPEIELQKRRERLEELEALKQRERDAVRKHNDEKLLAAEAADIEAAVRAKRRDVAERELDAARERAARDAERRAAARHDAAVIEALERDAREATDAETAQIKREQEQHTTEVLQGLAAERDRHNADTVLAASGGMLDSEYSSDDAAPPPETPAPAPPDSSSDDDDAAVPPAAASTEGYICLLYTSPSPRDRQKSRMPSSA